MDEFSILRVFVALLLVLGLIALSGWLTKRSGLSGKLSKQSQLRVVSKQPLGPKSSLIVVDVPGAQLVLGVTPTNINLLHTIECDTGLSVVSGMEQPSAAPHSKEFSSVLARFIPQARRPGTQEQSLS
jgi:flagellar protein FliO/FliZ